MWITLTENILLHIWIHISNGRSFFNIPHSGYTLNLYCTPSSHSTTGAGSNLGHFEEGSKSGTILGPHVKSNHWKIQNFYLIYGGFMWINQLPTFPFGPMKIQVSSTIQSLGWPEGSCQSLKVHELESLLNQSGTSHLISLPLGLVALIQWGTPYADTILEAS